jgi:hypothetical protein
MATLERDSSFGSVPCACTVHHSSPPRPPTMAAICAPFVIAAPRARVAPKARAARALRATSFTGARVAVPVKVLPRSTKSLLPQFLKIFFLPDSTNAGRGDPSRDAGAFTRPPLSDKRSGYVCTPRSVTCCAVNLVCRAGYPGASSTPRLNDCSPNLLQVFARRSAVLSVKAVAEEGNMSSKINTDELLKTVADKVHTPSPAKGSRSRMTCPPKVSGARL